MISSQKNQNKEYRKFNTLSIFERIQRVLIDGSQVLTYSLVFTHLSWVPYAHAGPTDGVIVGGSGSISQSDLTTTINQNTSSLAINWNSFDVGVNETVNFVQPTSSSIALNRILSNSASEIYGQINANGQVVLVNPNGVFFGGTSSVNVGGLIAAGLDISPADFMNGDYIFNDVLGTDGTVINSGLINASLGGNVALLGKQVSNEGVISAQLGSVNLAAGNAAVLTFDQTGMLGVQVTEAILQDELGIDPAVLNSGEINAQGGRVLLTASVSQDVFSQAVNSGELSQATSVVVNEDGTFTLGGGADVVNTGVVDVSTTALNQNAGQIVLLGENVTSSGIILADAGNADGGNIELHATDTSLLTENSITSAKSINNGKGGSVKVLGNNVGLFDTSKVDASGANGGGQVLLGGDKRGENIKIRNAEFTYISEQAQVKADANDNGDGGKIIAFADDTARVHGDLLARGGLNGGDGGFIETSGKMALIVTSAPDTSSALGIGGEWLIDPRDIDIVSTYTSGCVDPQCVDAASTLSNPFSASENTTEILIDLIKTALTGGNSVSIDTGSTGGQNGDITFRALFDYTGIGTGGTLTLDAKGDIDFTNISAIAASDSSNLSFNLYSEGVVTLGTSTISTNGGSFTVGDTSATLPTSFINNGTINTSAGLGGGAITINTSGDITLGSIDVSDTVDGNATDQGGAVTLNSGRDVLLSTAYDFHNTYTSTFTVNAARHINISEIFSDTSSGNRDTQNLILNSNSNDNGTGNVNITADIYTGGGNFTVTGVNFDSTGQIINSDDSNSVGGSNSTTGGDITLTMDGTVDLGNIIAERTENSGDVSIYALGAVTIESGATVGTRGGDLIVGFDDPAASPVDIFPTSFTNNGTIDTSSSITGGDLTINSSGSVLLGVMDVSDTSANNSDNDFGGSILVNSGGSITLDQDYDYHLTRGGQADIGGIGTSLTLNADDNININANIFDSDSGTVDTQNIALNANLNGDTTGNVNINADIYTSGGNFTVTGLNYVTDAGKIINTNDSHDSSLTGDGTSSTTSGGHIDLDMTGFVSLGTIITETSFVPTITTNSGNIDIDAGGAITVGGTITTYGGKFTVNSGASFDSSGQSILTTGFDDLNGGNISITGVTGTLETGVLTADGGTAVTADTDGNNAGSVTLTSDGALTVGSTISAIGSDGNDVANNDASRGKDGGTGGQVVITSNNDAVSVAVIDTSGGNASGDDDDGGNGGNADFIKIDAATTISVNSDLTAVGGDAAGKETGDIKDVGNGGDGALIQLIALDGISLNASVDASGGAPAAIRTDAKGSGLPGAGGAITINADANDDLTGDLIVSLSPTANTITTNGGLVTLTGDAVTVGEVITSGNRNQAGGAIDINATGAVNTDALTTTGGVTRVVLIDDSTANGQLIEDIAGQAGGAITIDGASVDIVGTIDTRGSDATETGGTSVSGGQGGDVDITATGTNVSVLTINTSGGDADDNNDVGANGGDAGHISIIAETGVIVSTLTAKGGNAAGDVYTAPGDIVDVGDGGTGGFIEINAKAGVTLNGSVDARGGLAADVTSGSDGLGNEIKIDADTDLASGGSLSMNDVAADTIVTNGALIKLAGDGVSVGDVTTTGRKNQNGGAIDIDSSITGVISTGILITDGGTTSATYLNTDVLLGDIIGKSGGAVTIDGATITTTGSISAVGSAATYTAAAGDTGQDGGVGGLVQLTATSATSGSIDVAGKITTDGGAGSGSYSTTDSSNGGNAGNITLTSSGVGSIILNDDLSAIGAAGFLHAVTDLHGNGGIITLDGDVLLSTSVLIESQGATDISSFVPGASGVFGLVDFKSSISGSAHRLQNLEITAGDINFAAEVGAINLRLGDLLINESESINTFGNLYLNSLDVLKATNFTVNTADSVIDTAGADTVTQSGGKISILATEIVDLQNLTSLAGARSANQPSYIGGDVTLTGASVSVGNIDTSGGLTTDTNRDGGVAGAVTITSIGTLNNNSVINLNGTIDTVGGDGTDIGGAGGAVNIKATGTATTSPVISILADITTSGGASTGGDVGGDAGAIIVSAIDDATADTLTGPVINLDANFISNGGSGITSGNSKDININLTSASSTSKAAVNIGYLTNFTSNVILNGSNGLDSLTAANRENNWSITAANDGNLDSNVTFNGFESLTGNEGIDNFVFTSAYFLGSIDGGAGAGANSLTGYAEFDTDTNTWEITGSNSGALNTASIFSRINNLIGTQGLDNFVISNGGLIGSIDGFSALGNTLTGDAVANTWTVDEVDGGLLIVDSGGAGEYTAVGDFLKIQKLFGNTADDHFILSGGTVSNGIEDTSVTGVDTLTGDNLRNTWEISSANQGTVEGTGGITPIVSFSGIENINGGTDSDVFNFTAAGSLTGLLDGGTNSTDQNAFIDEINYFTDINDNGTYAAIQLRKDTDLTGLESNGFLDVINVEVLTAKDTNTNTLIGQNLDRNWLLDGTNTGAVGDLALTTMPGAPVQGVVLFNEFQNLTGGGLDDNFIFQRNNSKQEGLILGGLGNDFLDLIVFSSAEVLLGTTLNPLVTTTNATVDGVETITAEINGSHTITGDSGRDNAWVINGDKAGTVNGTVQFNNFDTLVGGALADSFDLSQVASLTTQLNIDGGLATTLSPLVTTDTTVFDTLIGPDLINTTGTAVEWVINANNSTLNNNTADLPANNFDIVFNNIENLTGGAGNDSFTFNVLVPGLVNGGSNSVINRPAGSLGDTVDYSAVLEDVTLAFVSAIPTDILLTDPATLYVDGIEDVTAGGTGVVIGADDQNVWTIDGDGSGFVVSGTTTTSTLYFSGVSTLQGNNQLDTFTFLVDGKLNGIIDGGAGSLDSIEAFTKTGGNIWDIINDSTGAGTLNGGVISGNTDFVGIEVLIGAAGTVQDTLNAANFQATNNWNVVTDYNGTLNTFEFRNMLTLNGHDAANDIFTVSAAVKNGTFSGGTGGADKLIGAALSGGNLWEISANYDGDLNKSIALNEGIAFTGMETLAGNVTADTFNVAAGVTLGQFDGVDVNIVVAETGADIINVTDAGNIWSLDDNVSGQLNANIDFSSIEFLNGNNDTLDGPSAVTNNWAIDGDKKGTLNSVTEFTGMSIINGGTTDDNFELLAVISTGSFNGGAGGNDSLKSFGTSNEWVLSNNNDGTLNENILNGTGISFSGLETLLATSDTLTGPSVGNNFWIITDTGDGTLNSASLAFNGFNVINGGGTNDDFTIQAAVASGSFNGGASSGVDTIRSVGGSNQWTLDNDNDGRLNINRSFTGMEVIVGSGDSLTGHADTNNTWTITGDNEGNLNSNMTFSGIDDITGLASNDDFIIQTGVAIGDFDGGAGGTDTITSAVEAAGNIWNLTNENDGNINTNIVYSGMEELNGSTSSDTMNGPATPGGNTWNIDGDYSGDLNSLVTFKSMDIITGSSTNDEFILAIGVKNGVFNGGATGVDTFTAAAETTGNNWLLTSENDGSLNGTISFNGFEILNGNSTTDTITAAATVGGNTWEISDDYTGDLNTLMSFTEMDIINGNTTDDTFNLFDIVANGEFNGGLTGIDTINQLGGGNNWELDNDNDGKLNTLISFTGIENLNGISDTLNGASTGPNIWNIDDNNQGDLNGNLDFTGMITINGGAADDTFKVANNVSTGTFNGGATGVDTFELLSEVGVTDQVNAAENAWDITGEGQGTLKADISNTISFSEIENLIGNEASDNFTLSTDQFTGNINGGAGALIDIGGAVIVEHGLDSLTASANDNDWVVSGTDDGSVTDVATLKLLTFNDVENLIGSDAADDFIINDLGEVSGTIDGGTGLDTLVFNNKTAGGITVELGSALITNTPSAAQYFHVNGFENITGSSLATFSNTIIGADVNQLWVIGADNSGAVVNNTLLTPGEIFVVPAGDLEGVVKFSNFDFVTGGSADDSFRFENNAVIAGILSGGDHINGDTIDLSLQEVVDITVTFNDTTTTGVTTDIEGYRGNGYNSTLTASDSLNLWTLTGVNKGNVLNKDEEAIAIANGETFEAFTFEGFNILVGGNQVDDFVVEVGGSLEAVVPPVGVTPPPGIISGIFAGDGIDSLIVNLDGLTSNGALYFDGGTGIDNISFIDQTGSAGFDQAVFTPTASTDLDKDSVLYSFVNTLSSTNKYDVTYSNAELAANLDTVTDNVTATKLVVNGTSSDDTITIGSSSYQVVAATPATTFGAVTYTNKTHLDVIGGVGANDLINLSGNIGSSLADIHLGAETVNTTANNYLITANNLVLDTVAVTTQPLMTDVATLSITNSTANPASNIRIVETDGVVINALELTGSLDIDAGNTISLSAPVSSTAAIDLTAANGDILMAEPANSLSGELALRAVNGEIQLDNTALTTFADVTTQTLTVNSSAGIRDNGTIIATTAVLNAGTTGTIDLRSPSNDFDILEVGNALNIYVTDIDGIELSNINMGTGEFELNTGDVGVGVSQLANTRFTQEKTPVGLAGTVTFNAGANNIILDGANDFAGAVSLNNSGVNNVQITDVDNIIFGSSKIGSGTFRVDAGAGAVLPTDPGGISQIATSSIEQVSDATGNAGAVTLNAGFGIIDLDEAGNDFVGSVSLNNTSTDAVLVTDINSIDLASSNVGGQFDIQALNGITQSAALSIGGNANFTVNAGESIILGDTANNFQGGVSFTAGSLGQIANVTIANNAALNLGDISVSNNLDVFADGAVTNTGVLVSGGVTWINASGNAITLDNSLNSTSLNDFNEIVIVSGSSVLLTDINDIKLGTTDTPVPSLVIDSDITAGLTVVTQTGSITDVAGSTLTVVGQTSLSAGSGSGNIELNEVNNDFDLVDINTAANVTLVDLDGIDLRSTSINGFLDVTAGNDITNSGALNVTGTASFTANDTNNITLDHAANRLGGSLTFSSAGTLANVVVNNTIATDIQALTVSNDLTVTSAGTLSQSGSINVGGVTRLTAINSSLVDQDISLGSFVNNLTDLYVTNAHDVTIDNSANALTVSEMNASGAVNIITAGLVATTDIVGTDVTLNSGANSTQLVSVNATGAVNIVSEGLTIAEDLNGSSITGSSVFVDAGTTSALFTGSITSGSTIDVSALGITLNGAVNALNDASFDATTGVALLNNTIDVTTGDLSISGNGINQNNNLSVNTGNVSLISTQGISMLASTSTVVNNGNILYDAVNNVGVALLSAPNGTVEVNSGTGSIGDVNDTSLNFRADRLVLTAATGIGSGNELETQVDVLDAVNTVSGDVRFAQSGGTLVIDALKNDHSVAGQNLNITGRIDLRSTGDVIFEPGSVVANRLQGGIFMSTTGDFLGDRSILFNLDDPEITAFSAAFIATSGAFGVTGRPIVVNIPKSGSLFVNTRTNNIKYAPEKPDDLITTGLDVGSLGVVSAIAGELLVEIESLGDIDPAIFTDLQNYSREEISIRMPRDQLFDDELDEEEELEEELVDVEEADKYTQL